MSKNLLTLEQFAESNMLLEMIAHEIDNSAVEDSELPNFISNLTIGELYQDYLNSPYVILC